MKTKQQIKIEIEATDREVSALREQRAALPKNDDSLDARRLDLEIEEGLGRIADLNDEQVQLAVASECPQGKHHTCCTENQSD